jgi:hypothetical protein
MLSYFTQDTFSIRLPGPQDYSLSKLLYTSALSLFSTCVEILFASIDWDPIVNGAVHSDLLIHSTNHQKNITHRRIISHQRNTNASSTNSAAEEMELRCPIRRIRKSIRALKRPMRTNPSPMDPASTTTILS